MDEGSSTGFCGRVGKRDGFGPPGEAVDDREEILHALRLVERAHYVNVETSKAMVGRWSLREGCMNVAVNLRCLAGVAFPAPPVNVAFQAMSRKT